jgi:hypothetical protein
VSLRLVAHRAGPETTRKVDEQVLAHRNMEDFLGIHVWLPPVGNEPLELLGVAEGVRILA